MKTGANISAKVIRDETRNFLGQESFHGIRALR